MASSYPLLRSVSGLEIALAAMALLSLALILVPVEWMSRSLELVPQQYKTQLIDDGYSGGRSRVGWVNEAEHRWACELDESHANPYCNIQIRVAEGRPHGLDLSMYDRMTIWASYQGDAKHVRIYLRNRSPLNHNPNNEMTTKFNVVELPISELENGLQIRMGDFTVANWWLVQQEISLEHARPEFGDVAIIEVQTGSEARSGRHEIQIRKILWEGPIVSKVQLYQGIIIAWSALLFGALLYRVIRLNLELKKNREYQEELVAINQLLDLQSRKFEDLAKSDQLTGLLNRVGIRDALYEGLTLWKKENRPFSFIIIDIDKFKPINDAYGHDVGDEILKGAAKLLLSNVRSTDFLARWGGEEFILVCPGTTLQQALVVAESLRGKLAAASLYKDITITASFGVASMTRPDLDDLFKRADMALYRAKERGRNRVESVIEL